MRVIAGELRGRHLQAPRDSRVRPTADRVREAWFAILGNRVAGARVIDLFAGTGALGIEALSRGADHAVFVETSSAALTMLRANIDTLELSGRSRVMRTDALKLVGRLGPGAYDIAFADPPYASEHAVALAKIFHATHFAQIFCVEHRASDRIEGQDTRKYGDMALTFCYAP